MSLCKHYIMTPTREPIFKEDVEWSNDEEEKNGLLGVAVSRLRKNGQCLLFANATTITHTYTQNKMGARASRLLADTATLRKKKMRTEKLIVHNSRT